MNSVKKILLIFYGVFLLNSLLLIGAKDEFEDDDMEEEIEHVIGIDLGTTYSVVGIYKNGKVDIIANDQGNRITPSYVAFTPDGKLVGESAKNQASMNPEHTVFSVKRIIGRRFNEEKVQKDIKYLPYKVISKNNEPVIKVKENNKEKRYQPEEISALILNKMKTIAENYLGVKVKHAVITVPAYFNDKQRTATKVAGKIAGLNVLRIINEPTAAAIAYGLDKKSEKEKTIMVYDLGGGTFDVSVLSIEGGVFEVKATNGDTHLGGEDFDLRVAQHLAKKFKEKNNIDLTKNPKAFAKLKRESEKAKKTLSTLVKATVEIENIISGKDLKETLTRAEFEKLNMKFFRKTLDPVKTVLADAKLKKRDIDEIVLVGGSTRIPMVQKLLKDFFEGKELNKGINADEAVAHGAAVQGFILSGKSDSETKDVLLLDVTPLSLGIETVGGIHSKVIKKNNPIPSTQSQTFTTNEDKQTAVSITVFEGEGRMTSNCHLLGKFELVGIEEAPRGVPQIEVTFEIDANGILQVSAKDKASGKNNKISIEEAMSGSSNEEVKRMKENFEKNKEEDERMYNRTVAKNKLTSAIHGSSDYKTKNEKKLSAEDLDDLDNLIDEMKKWNEGASASEVEVEEFEAKLKEIEEILKELQSGETPGGDEEGEDAEEDKEDKEEAKVDQGKAEL